MNGPCAPACTTTQNRPRASDEGSRAGDPGDTDPAPLSPEGAGPHGGSVTRTCTEVRKRVCVTVDMADICLSALDPRGGCQPSCWDTEQQARPAGLRPQHTPLASPQP